MNQPNSQPPSGPAIPPGPDEPAAGADRERTPQPDAIAIGQLVISWNFDRPMQYGGPSDGPYGYEEVSFGLASKSAPTLNCDFTHVAPADTPILEQDARVTVSKRPREEKPEHAEGVWRLTLPGVPWPSWHGTKREATATGLRRLAILDWHAARKAREVLRADVEHPLPAAGEESAGQIREVAKKPDDQPGDYPSENLDLLIRSAGKLWSSTGGEDPHDVLSAPQRAALDLAAAVYRAELNRYPSEKLNLLIRSAGELWDSSSGEDPHHVLSAPGRDALDLAAAVYRAELNREMGADDALEPDDNEEPGTEAAKTQKYADGAMIEYTSFDPSGYSAGRVVRYAPDDEQWSVCPQCGQQAVPGTQDGDQRRCPRCEAFVRFPDLGPLVYIRAGGGGKPIVVRESQLRRAGQPRSVPERPGVVVEARRDQVNGTRFQLSADGLPAWPAYERDLAARLAASMLDSDALAHELLTEAGRHGWARVTVGPAPVPVVTPRYTARFTPRTQVNGQAAEVGAPGPSEWDCTGFAAGQLRYLDWLDRNATALSQRLDGEPGALDTDGKFRDDPAAPAWVRDWRGPFTITIRREG